MNNLNKKQKIVLIFISSIILVASASYYVYSKNNNVLEQIDNLETIEENENKETKEEKTEETIKIKVHISGAVNNEGIVELEENARVADAIEKAGGFKEDAYTDEINLAYILEDGIKVHIPTKEEYEKYKLNEKESNTQDEQYISTGTGASGTSEKRETTTETKTSKNSKVNINTANQAQLETLPGIGEATALKIINYRNENGKFKSIEGLKDVSGIGNAKFEKIKDLISV